jgi:hypothetical protein
MADMKKVVYTLQVDGYSPEITEITLPLLEAYAKKIGAEFVVINKRKFPLWPIPCEKFQIAELAERNQADWHIFFDADSLIHPDMFDVTAVVGKGVTLSVGTDFSPARFEPDKYFHRDGRWIGKGNWCMVGSDWVAQDLWRLPTDLTAKEIAAKIHPTAEERLFGVTPEHLVDDYIVSRNIARFGLKHMLVPDICRDVGASWQVYHHYLKTIEQKVMEMRQALTLWGISAYTIPKPEIEGWMSSVELNALYNLAAQMKSVVEVGSWKGRSTHALASACKGVVIAVDHFNGTTSELDTTHAEAKDGNIEDQFRHNTRGFKNISVLKMDSLQAALRFIPGAVDMVFIDGDHSYEAVKADIEAWAKVPSVCLCGHDINEVGVKKALFDLGIPYKVLAGSIWIAWKDKLNRDLSSAKEVGSAG